VRKQKGGAGNQQRPDAAVQVHRYEARRRGCFGSVRRT
jgi:hypothetical protein